MKTMADKIVKNLKKLMIPIMFGSVTGWFFYKAIIGVVIVSLILTIFKLLENETQDLKLKSLSFKAFLNGIYTELLVGQSFRNAVKMSQKNIFENDVHFNQAVNQLILEISVGTSEVVAWTTFAEQLNLEHCSQFVLTLRATYNQGGQISSVLRHTIRSISDQIDLELELGVMLSAKKLEFYLMMVIPIFMIGFLAVSNAEYMAVLYTTFVGRLVMTGVLLSLGIAYVIGLNIIKIEV